MIDRRHPFDRRQRHDRREQSRQASVAEIRFLRANSTTARPLTGELLDVSAIGVRLLLGSSVTVCERLLIEARDGANRCCNLTAQVVWTEATEEGRHRVGCELLVPLSERQLKLLRSFAVEQ